MKEMENSKTGWFGKFYKLLTFLVALSFIVLGAGILLKLLLPEPIPLSQTQRWIMGGIILAYGIARTLTLYRKAKKERQKEAT